MKLLPIVFILLMLGCASPKLDDYTKHTSLPFSDHLQQASLVINVQQNEPIDFRGAYELGQELEQADMTYYVSSVEGAVAQVITHAILNSNLQKNKLSQNQIKANKILAPIKTSLHGLTHQNLVHQSDTYTFGNNVATNDEILISSHPIFFISQDFKSITLKHHIKAQDTLKGEILYENMVEVIPAKFKLQNLEEELQKNKLSILKNISQELYKDSLKLAIEDMKGRFIKNKNQQKTYSFEHNGQPRFERGTWIKNDINNIVIRNLRGWIIAFPKTFQTKDS
ncbi:MAG: hypothetical protein QNK15_02205 [Cycloclasticus sp.]|nr:hypothetical protein [Cycloclasticus sp.]